MIFTRVAILCGVVGLTSAHGLVSGIVADGVYYQGYSPSMQYQQTPPAVVGWSIPEDQSTGFIDPQNYTTPEIICHLGATPGKATATVKAGGTVQLQWNTWPQSHQGPIMDYLANCNGDCASVDKTTLNFFKVDEAGLIDGSKTPGKWATDTLVANNNSWTVTIPTTLAPGNYVLRHEIIALHQAGSVNGAQNYPSCVNIAITGGGSTSPDGTLGEALYTPTSPGIVQNIYTTLSTYPIPGPTLISDATNPPQPGAA